MVGALKCMVNFFFNQLKVQFGFQALPSWIWNQIHKNWVVYNCFFLRKVNRQNDTNVTSCSMQLEKEGSGLLRVVYWGERECFIRWKRGGQIKKDRSWKTKVSIGALKVNKNECSISNCKVNFLQIHLYMFQCSPSFSRTDPFLFVTHLLLFPRKYYKL